MSPSIERAAHPHPYHDQYVGITMDTQEALVIFGRLSHAPGSDYYRVTEGLLAEQEHRPGAKAQHALREAPPELILERPHVVSMMRLSPEHYQAMRQQISD